MVMIMIFVRAEMEKHDKNTVPFNGTVFLSDKYISINTFYDLSFFYDLTFKGLV